jgi:GR25 family glycosyltransferase involved in LPS biosynthesis
LEIVQRVGNHTKADKKIAEVGHVACRMSHRLAIEAADADDDQITLILEGTLYFFDSQRRTS